MSVAGLYKFRKCCSLFKCSEEKCFHQDRFGSLCSLAKVLTHVWRHCMTQPLPAVPLQKSGGVGVLSAQSVVFGGKIIQFVTLLQSSELTRTLLAICGLWKKKKNQTGRRGRGRDVSPQRTYRDHQTTAAQASRSVPPRTEPSSAGSVACWDSWQLKTHKHTQEMPVDVCEITVGRCFLRKYTLTLFFHSVWFNYLKTETTELKP